MRKIITVTIMTIGFVKEIVVDLQPLIITYIIIELLKQ
tara:strand:+ start:93 stop:206 length:114 start_codon:yes stop_codon:yes gene_type:complete